MATREKPKPKSNRAKFTIQKKVEKEKPKAKVEKEVPKKEVKPVKKEQAPKEEVVREEVPVEKNTIEKEDIVPPAEIKEEEPANIEEITKEASEEKTETPKEQEKITEPLAEPIVEEPTTEIPSNPFAMDMPTTPPPTDVPLHNPELASDLPKEQPHASTSASVELETSGHGKGIILYFIIVALIAFIVGIGSMAAFTFGFGKIHGLKFPPVSLSGLEGENSPTPAHTITQAPTALPTKAVDLSAYTIKILNGSGITGAASKLKTELTATGFKVVSTANADRSDYTDTIIFAKQNINPEYMTKLKAILKNDYSLGADSQLPSTDSTASDLIITIGSNTAK